MERMKSLGYNRIKQKLCFCFFVAGAGLACAASAADAQTEGWKSVVRVDPKTGHLVRSVVPSGPARLASARKTTEQVDILADNAAAAYRVDPALVRSVIDTESANNPNAVSPKGAVGLMQLMPETARRFGVANPFDPQENILGGVRYLKYLQELFQDDQLAIAAYNAGEGAVVKYRGVPPYQETKAYVERVSAKARRTKAAGHKQPAAPPKHEAAPYAPVTAYYDAEGRLHLTTQ
jgi:soluble lytic murein transglycosylase-like protein